MKFFFFMSAFMAITSFAQTTSYDDVGVIVNVNSPVSMQIASYFQQARNIPNQNMIYVSSPTTEVINDTEFNQLRTQIENYLVSQNLQDSLNYLVTTKGVPLKRNSIDCVVNAGNGDCGSVDAELSLILGIHQNQIGQASLFVNPYFNKNEHFSRAQYGIYLVTRLDGYSQEDVLQMIDRSGPLTVVDQQIATGVIDLVESYGMDTIYFIDSYVQPTYDNMLAENWNATMDLSPAVLTDQNNVFTYFYVGHGPVDSIQMNYKWLPGSFSALSTCSSAETFDAQSNPNESFYIADLIKDGCTAAHGYVNCIYITQLFRADILVNRYLNPIEHYNLAESYYMADMTLSYQSVVIGDPKASIVIDSGAGIPTSETPLFRLYPNPSTGTFQIKGIEQLKGHVSIAITNSVGMLMSTDSEVLENESYVLEDSGVYFISILEDGKLVGVERHVKQ